MLETAHTQNRRQHVEDILVSCGSVLVACEGLRTDAPGRSDQASRVVATLW